MLWLVKPLPCGKRRERNVGVVEGKPWLRGSACERMIRTDMCRCGNGKRTRFAITVLGFGPL